MVKSAYEFISLVSKMREAQRKYFSYRSKENLNIAKTIEGQVDDEIARLEKRQEEESQPQLGM